VRRLDAARSRRARVSLGVLALCLLVGATAGAQAPLPMPAPLAAPTPDDLAAGARLYQVHCARCHGLDGSGGMGPPLARPKLRRAADEAGIIEVLSKGVPGTSMIEAWYVSPREMQQLAAHVRSLGRPAEEPLPGDPAAGRAVYGRAGCATCHIVDGEGIGYGPDLSDVGERRGAGFLRESLLEPAAALPERTVPYEPYGYPAYVLVRAQPRGGAEVIGVRVNEDSFTIQLRDAGGRFHSFRKADLQQLAADTAVSPMPSYRGVLNDGEIDDLVAYLMTRSSSR
jgi:cytochrome c oxidase cbb3-type subunit III